MKTIFTGLFIFISLFSLSQEDRKLFSVINKSSHKTELIFDNRKTHFVQFGAALFRDWQIYKEDNALFIYLPYKENIIHQIKIEPDTVKVKTFERLDIIQTDSLQVNSFRTNMHYFEDDSGFYAEEIFETVKYIFAEADVFIYREGNRCDDSGMNSVKVQYKNGYVFFKNMNNIKVFEYDLNKDGKNEIYIINFSCCDEKLKIYKIF